MHDTGASSPHTAAVVARHPRSGPRLIPLASRIVSTHGLLALLVLLTLLFSLLLPRTFPTAYNFQAILNNKAITMFLALAVMVPMTAGEFDLSVGYVLGLTHILAVGLQIRAGWPWPVVVLSVLLLGAVIGLINGLLVTRAKIDSFIATLGAGTVVYGISNWYTGGQQIFGSLAGGFTNIATATLLGIPAPALYVLIVGILLWIAYEYLPIGRFMYALGANARAAQLTGISPQRYIVLAFVASGLLSAIAGIVLGAQLRAGQSDIGPDYLLPAFVGAFLGSTSVRPGRANVWGTILAVLLLSVGISGIEQMGAQFFVEPMFNGGTLLIAVGLAGYAARRRLRSGAVRERSMASATGTGADATPIVPATGADGSAATRLQTGQDEERSAITDAYDGARTADSPHGASAVGEQQTEDLQAEIGRLTTRLAQLKERVGHD